MKFQGFLQMRLKDNSKVDSGFEFSPEWTIESECEVVLFIGCDSWEQYELMPKNLNNQHFEVFSKHSFTNDGFCIYKKNTLCHTNLI